MKKIKLRDFLDTYGDGIHGTPLYDEDGEFYFINGNNLQNGEVIISSETPKISLSEYRRIYRPLGDRTILLSINGTLGNIAIYKGEKIALGKSACFLNVKEDKNLHFIKYVLSTQEFKKYISLVAHGSTIKNLAPSQVAEYEFEVPLPEIQDKIATTLGALDNKIALNKKINATLEAMAKTLYDYWFVQFDFPDENGKPYKTSGGKMIYSSELGRDIPVGWEVKTLGDLLTENTTLFNQQTIEPTIDLSVMPSSSIALDELSSSEMFSTNLFKMKEGDILFGSIRPYLKKAGIAPCNGVVVGTVHSYQAKKEFDYTFALFTVCRDKFFDYAVKVSTGTRMPIIKSENLLSYKIAYSENVVRLFDMPNLKRIICKNVQENRRLAELRDWLLPMLMNGQVKFQGDLD